MTKGQSIPYFTTIAIGGNVATITLVRRYTIIISTALLKFTFKRIDNSLSVETA